MNLTQDSNEHEPEDQRAIERLVDGELDEQQRQRLLASLDYTDDGWRQLALRYVEAQAWQQDFEEIVPASSVSNLSAIMPTPATTQAKRSAGRWTIATAMAVSFLAAVGFGLMIRTNPDATPGPAETQQVADTGEVNSDNARAEKSPVEAAILHSDSPITLANSSERGIDSLDDRSLASKDETNNFSGAVELPVYVVNGETSDWHRSLPPALPQHVTESLERLGHSVHSQRQLLPIRLPDGRRVIVPIEQVDVEFVGPPEYQ